MAQPRRPCTQTLEKPGGMQTDRRRGKWVLPPQTWEGGRRGLPRVGKAGLPCPGRWSRTCKFVASYRSLSTSLNCTSGVDLATGVCVCWPLLFNTAGLRGGCRSARRRTQNGRRYWHQEALPCQLKSSVHLELDNSAELLSL